MKVILLDDVARVGHEGEVVEVTDGYFRNYLAPRKLAVKATQGPLKDLEARSRAIEKRDQQKREKAEQAANRLRGQKVTVRAPTGEGTKLHGSVTAQQIAGAAREQLNFELDRRDIDIPEPIRETGDYLVSAKVYKDVVAQLAVSVVPLDAEEKKRPSARAGTARETTQETAEPTEEEVAEAIEKPDEQAADSEEAEEDQEDDEEDG